MEHDHFVPAVRPLFLNYGLSEFRVKILIEDAQQDLYYPLVRPFSCVHVTYARKVTSWTPPRRPQRPSGAGDLLDTFDWIESVKSRRAERERRRRDVESIKTTFLQM